MNDKNIEIVHQHLMKFAKDTTLVILGMIDDERIDTEVQSSWISRIQEASNEEMPEVLESIKQELKLIMVDTSVVN